MRTLAIFLSGLLVFPAGTALLQEPDDEEQEEEALPREGTIAGVRAREQLRIQKELEGAWLLMHYQPAVGVFDQENVQGFAIFQSGFLSLTFQAQTFDAEFLGPGYQAYVQGSAHRYRINKLLELQTAAILGFHNFDDIDEITFEVPSNPREYRISLTGDDLTLIGSDETTLTLRRVKNSDFPQEAVDFLEQTRGR